MNYQELIKAQYPQTILPREILITHTNGVSGTYIRDYDCMSLQRFYPIGLFTTKWGSVSIQSKLNEKYQGHTYEFFRNNNLLPQPSEVVICDLRFYQDEIDLNGLDKIGNNITYLEEPVLIINDDGQLILYNGYHRTTIHLLNNKTTIKGYIFEV